MSERAELEQSRTWALLEQHGKQVPDHLWLPITRFVEQGLRTDVCVNAIFTNDLRNAIAFADTQTLIALRPTVLFIYRHLPHDCQGSACAVKDWSERGGLAAQAVSA